MTLASVREIVKKTRSKNAGPFWLTIDIFCGSKPAFEEICVRLDDVRVAQALGVDPKVLKRFEIPELNVVKFSLPRPIVQGSLNDMDLHGASYANLIAEIDLDQNT